MLSRVRAFSSDARVEKLRRFETTHLESLDDFATRQLNETRYASRLARQFLGTLYGAGATGVDPGGTMRVQAARGQVTSVLRNAWDLNAILGGGEKRRDDHRQHAVDAVVVALTDPGTVKRLSDASAKEVFPARGAVKLPAPWGGFLDEMRGAVEGLVVSHRLSRKVNAALHEETHYSKIHQGEDGKPYVHVRKPLEALSENEVRAIVDPAAAAAVRAKLDDLGMKDPKQAFKSRDNHPMLRTKDGRDIPIHRVRIRKVEPVETIGAGARERRVALGSNHHIEIVETTDRKGAARWEGVVVSTFEAARRLRAGEPVVKRDHGAGRSLVFSLAGGDMIEADDEDGARRLYRVRTVSDNLEFVALNDAREKKEIKQAQAWKKRSVDKLRELHCHRVIVTPLGEVRRAND